MTMTPAQIEQQHIGTIVGFGCTLPPSTIASMLLVERVTAIRQCADALGLTYPEMDAALIAARDATPAPQDKEARRGE